MVSNIQTRRCGEEEERGVWKRLNRLKEASESTGEGRKLRGLIGILRLPNGDVS